MSLQLQITNQRTGQIASALQNSTAILNAQAGDPLLFNILRGPVSQSFSFQYSTDGSTWTTPLTGLTDAGGNYQTGPITWSPPSNGTSYYRVTWP